MSVSYTHLDVYKRQVYVNGKLYYRGIYPKIKNYQLDVWRRENAEPSQISPDGPHFDLMLPTLYFIQSIGRELIKKPMAYTFQGTYLGGVNENWGAAARSMGLVSRTVNLIELNMHYENKILFINISGTAIDDSPWANEKTRLKPISFEIKCPIPVALISRVFQGPDWEVLRLQESFECESDEEYWELINNGTRKKN